MTEAVLTLSEEDLASIDPKGKSIYYPTRKTESHTVTYKINGVKYEETLGLKYDENFLKTTQIWKQKGDGLVLIDVNSTEFADAATSNARIKAINKGHDDIEALAKRLGKNHKFQEASNLSGMNTVIENGYTINDTASSISTEYDELQQAWNARINAAKSKNEETFVDKSTGSQPTKIRDPKMSLAGMNMQYPLDAMYDKGQDYVFIEQFKYSPPQASASNLKNKNNQKQGWRKNKASERTEAYNQHGLSQMVGLTAGMKRETNIKESQGSVKLPIPNQLNVSTGVGWGEGRANAVEAGAFFSAMGGISGALEGKKSVPDIIGDTADTAGGLLNSLKKDASQGGQSSQILSATLAKAALAKLNINVDTGQFITRSTGNAINPNLELLFSGPKLRNFSLAFKFAANSEKEAAEIRKILRWFKQGMAPRNDFQQTIFLGSPNVFRIKYMNSGRRIKGLNMFKICAMTAFEIDFAPQKVWQSYEDGSAVSMPPLITAAASFTELTPIFSGDFEHSKEGQKGDMDLGDARGEFIAEATAGNAGAGYNDLGLSGNDNIGQDDVGF
tara:strand:- start:1131 stop:2810 length:1680 start_codon:yes stop_codon:yes gene_type:complete